LRRLWKTDALVAATGGALAGEPPNGISGVSIDSRTVGEGEAFFAIRGDRFDGHDFVSQALQGGAGLAVVSREKRDLVGAGPLLVVDDPLAALERLGQAARARIRGRVAAITGSVGKTSTKEMLRVALAGQGSVHSPVGSFNNHWGVPLTLARMPAETAFGIFEIGMNHANEIRPLTRMVKPDVALVTTVEAVHIENFESVEEIALAKAEIFDGLSRGGVAVLNRDNRWFDLLADHARGAGARIVSFGERKGADVQLERLAMRPDGSSIEARVQGASISYRLGAPGRHFAQNSLGVIAAVHALKADLERAAKNLAGFSAPKGRGERVRLAHSAGPFTLIDESYNANPASMRAALAVLGQTPRAAPGRRIVVLGDMLELGQNGPEDHAALAPAIAEADVDLVFLVGPLMANLWDALPQEVRGAYARAADDVRPVLLDAVRAEDVVMVKASAGTRLGSVVEALKGRFPAAGS